MGGLHHRQGSGTIKRITLIVFGMLYLGACAETKLITHAAKRTENAVAPAPAPATGTYKVGKPYQVAGVWYYPAEDWDYDETGIASWYGSDFHGKPTANGEVYDMNDLTAAHKTLPLPTMVRVTNLDNGRGLTLRLNDRGPFVHGRIIDISRRGAQLLGFETQGTAKVRVQILEAESRTLIAQLRGGATLASADSPLIVDRLPKDSVSAETLAPPPGATVRSEPSAAAKPVPLAAVQPEPAPAAKPATGVLSTVPVKDTRIYVQAGSFSQFVNANRVRAVLSPLGGVKIHHAVVRDRDVYRVRMGPIATVEEADRALEGVIQAGYPDARIIVD